MEGEATIVSLSATSSPDHHTMPSAHKGYFILLWAQEEENKERRKKRMEQR